jgi:putative PIN family toxin of toxin-antitoxin system
VSALIGKGKTLSQLYEAFLDAKFTPLLSPEMMGELVGVIRRPKFKKYLKVEDLKRFEKLIETDTIPIVASHKLSICRDPKDNMLLECALSSEIKPDFIVTGDEDLLILKSFHDIPIITPKEFLNRLRSK